MKHVSVTLASVFLDEKSVCARVQIVTFEFASTQQDGHAQYWAREGPECVPPYSWCVFELALVGW